MDDVTNYTNNVGKPLAKQAYDVRLSYRELGALRALAQNPHPAYMENPEMLELATELFGVSKQILDVATTKALKREDNILDL